jgi:hypothetical protein
MLNERENTYALHPLRQLWSSPLPGVVGVGIEAPKDLGLLSPDLRLGGELVPGTPVLVPTLGDQGRHQDAGDGGIGL